MCNIRKKLNKLLSEHTLLQRKVEDEKDSLQKAESYLLHVQEAQQVLQSLAEGVQNLAITKIAEIVTRCLQAIFGEDSYEFCVNFSKKRNRTEARLYLVNSDGREIDPVTSCGGGVLDICTLALRLSALVLSRPSPRRLLVCDEPFRFVSKQYRPLVRKLLKSLAKELGVQMVLVTHSSEFEMGTVINLEE